MKLQKKSQKKNIIVVCAIIALSLVSYGAYAKAQDQWPFTNPNSAPEESADDAPTSKDTLKNTDSDGSGITSTKDESESTTSAQEPNSGVSPEKPVGTFVSNHRPNLSGSPAPNEMSSTCTTTPGVYCTIQFTQGSVTKSLPVKTTNATGSVSWNWALQDVGLTVGDWKVSAIANSGNNYRKATDPMPLTVER